MAVPLLLSSLSQEVRELAAPRGAVPRVRAPLSPLEFHREFVAQNRPCVVEGALEAWPALALWSDAYLAHAMGSRECHVDLTPDGRGDALVRSAVPEEGPEQGAARGLAPLPSPGTGPPLPSRLEALSLADSTRSRRGAPGADCRGGQAGGRWEGAGAGRGRASPAPELEAAAPSREGAGGGDAIPGGRGALGGDGAPGGRGALGDDGAPGGRGALGDDGAPGGIFFTTPFSTRMAFADFLCLFRDSRADPGLGVPYVQHQNSSLTTDFSILASDVAGGVPFASEALGAPPEATNFWLGDDRAETSWHKDHYENLYAVVAGEKHFLLMPPCDAPRMAIRPYCAASYWKAQAREGPFLIVPESPRRTVPWASVDASLALLPGTERGPLAGSSLGSSALASPGPGPISCTLRKGDLLYLPAMWFHHVRQTPDKAGRTIAVNFWYDMAFDAKYAYYNLVQGLTSLQ